MAQPWSLPLDVPHPKQPGVLSPKAAAWAPTELPEDPDESPMAGPPLRVRTHALRQVVVLEFSGTLGEVIEDLDRSIQFALADGPRGVVCDLSALCVGAESSAVELLATAGRHVRDWPGIPVVVAGSKRAVREVLPVHPLGRHLILRASVREAVSAVLQTPLPVIEWLRLAPHPTAPRASRNFVSRTLLDWGLGRLIPSASLVVSELVTSSTIHAGSDVDLSISWNLEALRLTVRDNSFDLPRQRFSHFDQNGRGLSAVAGLSRSFGVLPTHDGKVVWAVLNAARPTRQLKSAIKRCPDTEEPTQLYPFGWQETQDRHPDLFVIRRTNDPPRC
ncbi:MAG: hypothetical protein ABI662_10675 [Dermatophilaceae bacterium]